MSIVSIAIFIFIAGVFWKISSNMKKEMKENENNKKDKTKV